MSALGEDERNDERITWRSFSFELLRAFVAPEIPHRTQSNLGDSVLPNPQDNSARPAQKKFFSQSRVLFSVPNRH